MHSASRVERVVASRCSDLLLSAPFLRPCSIPKASTSQNSFTRSCSTSISKPPFWSFKKHSGSSFALPICGPPNPHFHRSTRQVCVTSQKRLDMDLDDTNDPNIRAAIAASLGDTRGSEGSPISAAQNPKQDVVDLTGESDDELIQTFPKSQSVVTSDTEDGGEEDDDLRRAIELSMQGSRDEVDLTELPDTPRESEPEPSGSVKGKAPTSMGLLGLNRKQMEEERLSRVSKRKSEDPSLDEPLSKHPRTSASLRTGRSKSPSTRRIPVSKGNMQPATPSNKPGIQFPTGTVKKTWAFGCPRVGDDIKIEEVFQPSDLELAVLGSFMWDMEWLFSKLDTRRSRFLLVMQAKEEYTVSSQLSLLVLLFLYLFITCGYIGWKLTGQKRQYESDTADMPNLRLCFPPMGGQVNCMHSKLMLLFHPGYVRIVVPTANLTPFDWGEQGGVMENVRVQRR
jgi:hypothetical protein